MCAAAGKQSRVDISTCSEAAGRPEPCNEAVSEPSAATERRRRVSADLISAESELMAMIHGEGRVAPPVNSQCSEIASARWESPAHCAPRGSGVTVSGHSRLGAARTRTDEPAVCHVCHWQLPRTDGGRLTQCAVTSYSRNGQNPERDLAPGPF